MCVFWWWWWWLMRKLEIEREKRTFYFLLHAFIFRPSSFGLNEMKKKKIVENIALAVWFDSGNCIQHPVRQTKNTCIHFILKLIWFRWIVIVFRFVLCVLRLFDFEFMFWTMFCHLLFLDIWTRPRNRHSSIYSCHRRGTLHIYVLNNI